MMEFWKDIKGFEGLYQISSTGRVKSLARILIMRGRWGNKIEVPKEERILIPSIHSSGYYYVSLCSAGMRKNRDTHRLLAEAFIPNPGNKEQVGHKNGVKTDVRIDNLVWCDRVENTIHFHYYDCINTKLDKKRKFVLDISTGVFFYSIAEAAQAINKGHEWLRQRLNGKLKNKTNLVFV